MDIVIVIILGLLLGSFSSVLISRLTGNITWKKIKGILRGRSCCPDCKHTLHAQNLVPVFSYFFQGGRCTYCEKKIAFFYPLIELLTAGVVLITYLFVNNEPLVIQAMTILINWLLLVLFIHDIRYYELNTIVYTILVLLTLGFYTFIDIKLVSIGLSYAVAFFVIYLLIYYFAKWYAKKRKIAIGGEGMGFGDVIFAGYVGLLVAYYLPITTLQSFVYLILIYIIGSSILGVIYYGILKVITIFIPRTTREVALPFLPAMITMLWIIMFYPQILFLF